MRKRQEIVEAFNMICWLHGTRPSNHGWWMAAATLAWVLRFDNFFIGEQFLSLLAGWKDQAKISGYKPPKLRPEHWQ